MSEGRAQGVREWGSKVYEEVQQVCYKGQGGLGVHRACSKVHEEGHALVLGWCSKCAA